MRRAGGGGLGRGLRSDGSGTESGSGDESDRDARELRRHEAGTMVPMRRSRSEQERRRRASSSATRRRYTEHVHVRPSCCGIPEDDEGRCCLCRCVGANLPFWCKVHAVLLLAEAMLAAVLLASTAGVTFCEALPDTWPDTREGQVACTNECPDDCFRMSGVCKALMALAVVFRAFVAAAEARVVQARLWLSRRPVRALYILSALSWPLLLAWLWFTLDAATMFTFSRRLEFGVSTALTVLSALHLPVLAAVTHTARVQGEHLRIEAEMHRRRRTAALDKSLGAEHLDAFRDGAAEALLPLS